MPPRAAADGDEGAARPPTGGYPGARKAHAERGRDTARKAHAERGQGTATVKG
ncbi:hypothetical protein ABZT34_17895 [Streptomyces sp. NPDC005329]|uniref:hypothetical protein n=1 Tax=Streptomyces sp. NPDC005329 TaxID=3157034 RepID=UPI00339E88C0